MASGTIQSPPVVSDVYSALSNTVRWYIYGKVCFVIFYGVSVDADLNSAGLPVPVSGFVLIDLVYSTHFIGVVQRATNGNWSITTFGSGAGYTVGYGTGCYLIG